MLNSEVVPTGGASKPPYLDVRKYESAKAKKANRNWQNFSQKCTLGRQPSEIRNRQKQH
jgi:hypothetical protein